MLARLAVATIAALLLLAGSPADAQQARRAAMPGAVLDIAREHRRSLESSIPKRERDVKETAASLDRNSALYARGAIDRAALAVAAREAGEARAQLEWTRQEIERTAALILEIEARRRLASRPPLRPGQYEAGDGLVRFLGHRPFSLAQLSPLGQFFAARMGRPLPVSAHGQTEVHTRLGLDHRNAVDVALHPDSVEGRLVMSWLREQGISFMAFSGPRFGAATGAHIHVGPPSERMATATARSFKGTQSVASAAPTNPRAESPRPTSIGGSAADAARRVDLPSPSPVVPAPATQVLTR